MYQIVLLGPHPSNRYLRIPKVVWGDSGAFNPTKDMTDTERRPVDTRGTNRRKDTDDRGKHPSDGLAGKIHASQSTAPADADWREVLSVAWVAFDTDCSPSKVWRRKRNRKLDEYEGDEQ